MNHPSPEDFNDLSKMLVRRGICDEDAAKNVAAFASKSLDADRRVDSYLTAHPEKACLKDYLVMLLTLEPDAGDRWISRYVKGDPTLASVLRASADELRRSV